MDWDDDFDNGSGGMDNPTMRDDIMGDTSRIGDLNPMGISDPASAYFLLSDDAQDEIIGTDKKRMKCLSCGHRFRGEIYERCPKCDSFNTEEILSFLDDEDEDGEAHNMKCLSCGQTFVGEIFDRCPECFSMDTEEAIDENDDGY